MTAQTTCFRVFGPDDFDLLELEPPCNQAFRSRRRFVASSATAARRTKGGDGVRRSGGGSFLHRVEPAKVGQPGSLTATPAHREPLLRRGWMLTALAWLTSLRTETSVLS